MWLWNRNLRGGERRLVRLRDRIAWLESGRDQRNEQSSTWTSGASGSVPGSGSFRGGSWDSRSWSDQFM